MSRVLILFAHPALRKSRVNKVLREAATGLAQDLVDVDAIDARLDIGDAETAVRLDGRTPVFYERSCHVIEIGMGEHYGQQGNRKHWAQEHPGP